MTNNFLQHHCKRKIEFTDEVIAFTENWIKIKSSEHLSSSKIFELKISDQRGGMRCSHGNSIPEIMSEPLTTIEYFDMSKTDLALARWDLVTTCLHLCKKIMRRKWMGRESWNNRDDYTSDITREEWSSIRK